MQLQDLTGMRPHVRGLVLHAGQQVSLGRHKSDRVRPPLVQPGQHGGGQSDSQASPVFNPDLSRPTHELRALSASLALHCGAALEDITKAVGWTSTNTFGWFYQRSMPTQTEVLVRLPASGRNSAIPN
jgi:hypothetical protein